MVWHTDDAFVVHKNFKSHTGCGYVTWKRLEKEAHYHKTKIKQYMDDDDNQRTEYFTSIARQTLETRHTVEQYSILSVL